MKKNLIIFSVMVNCSFLEAQTLSPAVLSSGGAFYSAGGYLLSQTLGELAMVQTFSSGNSILTQGFQQPEPIVTGIDESSYSLDDIFVYPNPANDFIYVEIKNGNADYFQFRLFNTIGQLVFDMRQKNPTAVKLDVRKVSPGLYFLQIEYSDFKHAFKFDIAR